MQTVVITGGARGLGAGIALAFYRQGFNVVVADTREDDLSVCMDAIEPNDNRDRIQSVVCDVTQEADVQRLWDITVAHYGRVDYWINNAGLGGTQCHVADSDLSRLLSVIDVNLKGVVIGTKIALNGMHHQDSGRIYNMAGFGVDGMMRKNMVIYGTTKRAVGYFSQAVAKEQEGSSISVGWINPGMVVTPMIVAGAQRMGMEKWRQGGRAVFNFFGETPEVTGELIVSRILNDRGNGAMIKILSVSRMLYCVMRFLFGKKRDLFATYGI